jgi:serine/threonine-protein kinase HipA
MQEKLLLSRLADGWGLPVDGAPSTHILKPAHPFLVGSVLNEAFCMRIAHHLGVDVAAVEVRRFDDVTVLVVERYDRAPSDGLDPVARIHQEDFSQAHAVGSRRKYEEAGGPSLLDCARMLLRWSSSEQLDRLLDIVTVNALVGNADAHAKNLALLHGVDGRVQLAPGYDIMATTLYPDVSTTAGMFINGLRDLTAVRRDDLVREAERWGLAHSRAAERVDRLLTHAEQAIGRAAADVRPPDSLVAAVLTRLAACWG